MTVLEYATITLGISNTMKINAELERVEKVVFIEATKDHGACWMLLVARVIP